MSPTEALAAYNQKFPKFPATLSSKGGETIVAPKGQIDQDNFSDIIALLEAVSNALERDDRLIVDMTAVNYISSTGVGALSKGMVNAEKRGVLFYIRGISKKVRDVLQLLDLMTYFKEG